MSNTRESNGIRSQSLTRATSSPLRTEQKVDNLSNGHIIPGSQSPRSATSGSIRFADGPNGEFPFHATNGTSGQSPTNELFNKAKQPTHSHTASVQGQTPDQHMTTNNDEQPLSRKWTNQSGAATPPGRRSVQFARPDPSHSGQARQQSWEVEEGDNRGRQGSSFMSKLKALASPMQTHSRTMSGLTVGDSTIEEHVPTTTQSEPGVHGDTGSEADADGEESADEEGAHGSSSAPRTKRKTRRPPNPGTQTAPTTPRTPRLTSFFRDRDRDSPVGTPNTVSTFRPTFLTRRATMTDIPEDRRAGLSEDEGRNRLEKQSTWRRGSARAQQGWGLSYSLGRRQQDGEESPDTRRPINFRRITGLGQGANGEPSPLAWRRQGDRTASVSAAKWREIKAGIKAMGRKKKDPQMLVDHQKSAELMAELLAGAPAALFAASMFQSDEHGRKRLPVLLEQLKVRIVDSQRIESRAGDRHMVFKIEMEYGSGLTRMKWVIHRTLRDFTNLHVKYKLQMQQEKYIHRKGDDPSRARLPRFPRSAFPYLRGVRGLADEDEEEGEDGGTGGETSDPHGDASGTDRPARNKRRRSSFNPLRRKSSIGTIHGTTGEMAARTGGVVGALATAQHRREPYQERQRKKLETYLQQMIRFLIFRADSNRLCKFLELSALGIRLASEGGYHGKEGLMVIQSGKGVDFRRALNPALIKERHRPMWFLVRHSYVVCVDSPESMNIYDVFLVDPDFATESRKRLRDQNPQELAKSAKPSSKHHLLRLRNSERKLKLLARNERQLQQFKESISFMMGLTEWSKPHRFDSFAPVRYNVFARWLVDGRDYMWNVSRAISMARDVVYIHDWWLSPELYMRRPAAISQKWRLDRLLQKKAQEGVKIYIIVYRNINSAIPIDSEYTKFSLLDLHANIFVQRSPNQFRQNTFFWAHHEKLCIIDHSVAFCGGVDLCFGRWDTPEHSLVDDKLTGFELNDAPKDADHCQLWPGKDYSNPRVQDFYALDKPYEEMYDRTKIPRMPWHDIAMQMVGQPARDLTRHFVQRWNYILRQRKPSRPTPFLLPPPDFIPEDIQALGLDGTCEVQILRSCSSWSIGTPDKTEHSIMNAYVKLIEESEHFIYIENQFFISSCNVDGTLIQNTIGDAIVERIKRAYANDEDWRIIIVIPLMPGFQNTVDAQDGTSVRLIMQCQYRSISRGDTSIFARLRDAGIEPEDYIQFYSLRQWGKIGPRKVLITEQLYIHAKCMIVDDRVVIMGSANINERSMLGSRDSEVAAVVRDTDMIPSVMAGEEYAVGRFPHTLRMRLMREHLGIDVDTLEEEERDSGEWDRDTEQTVEPNSSSLASPATIHETERKLMDSTHRIQDDLIARSENLYSFNHEHEGERSTIHELDGQKDLSIDAQSPQVADHQRDVRGEGADNMRSLSNELHVDGGRDSAFVGGDREVLVNDIATEGKGTLSSPGSPKNDSHGLSDFRKRSATQSKTRHRSKTLGLSDLSHFDSAAVALPPPTLPRMDTQALGLTQLSQLPALPVTDDTDIGGPPLTRRFSNTSAALVNPLISSMRRPVIDDDCMRDPVSPSFFLDIWHAVAENNTKLYRQVFRCMPDTEARDWRAYKEFTAYNERFMQAQGLNKPSGRKAHESGVRSGPPGTGTKMESIPGLSTLQTVGEKAELAAERFLDEISGGNRNNADADEKRDASSNTKLENVSEWAEDQTKSLHASSQLDEKLALKAADDDLAASKDSIEKDNNNTPTPNPSSDTTIAATTPDRPRSRTLQNAESQTNSNGLYSSSSSTQQPLKHSSTAATAAGGGGGGRRRRATTRSSAASRAFAASDELLSKDEAEALLKLVQGTLVCWPYDWLEKEERGGNWLYNIDQIAPIEIYD
ncbi:phospholipase D [Viridothelium virens]|uniref:Phospholipase D1 n=1 Tax=Viridothelium virens TaxID=1048519 RepID=A0A6A6H8Y3_VIRVR|nr:phospholipase D [Viridothelium virens]